MPFVSDAQRKWRWANKPEMAKHWQEVTPKGKKLPEHVKHAEVYERSIKIAGDFRDFISEHPIALGLGAAGLGGGGILAKRLLISAAPAKGLLKTVRPLAEKEGISVLMPGSATAKGTPTFLSKLKAKAIAGGAVKPILTDTRYNILRQKGIRQGKRLRGVTLGANPLIDRSSLELEVGGLPSGKRAKQLVQAHQKLEAGGKVMEGSKLNIGKYMAPGTSALDIATKYRIPLPRANAGPESKAKFLSSLQSALKKEYRDAGFFAKPHKVSGQAGAFASEQGNWGKLYKDYVNRLKPEIEARTQQLQKQKLTIPTEHIIRKEFGKDPAYTARFFDQIAKQLGKTRVEQKLPISKVLGKPVEYRVHAIGGEVPKELAYNRYMNVPGVGSILRGKRFGSSEEAAKWFRTNILPKLPEKVRKGTFGADVVRVKKPAGGYEYKLIELNPTSHSGHIGSGFMDPMINPVAPHKLYRWIHGKDAPMVTAGKALATGGLLGLGTGMTAKALGKEKHR